jgi:hypothetical protein
MAINTQDFAENSSREFSDDMIRRFLLGDLNTTEQPMFERRLFTDLGLDARVSRAELELADDYAFGRLSAGQRILFEERFLLTSNRRQKLQVSRVLRERFSPARPVAAERLTAAQKLKSLFGLDRPVWRIAFGAVILLLLFGTAWLLIKEPRIVHRVTEGIIPRRSAPANAPRPANHPTNTDLPEHTVTPSPMPVHDRPAIVIRPAGSPETIELSTVDLTKSDDVVKLRLVLRPDQTGPYRADVQTIDGASVFSADALQPVESGTEIDFEVPSRLLKIGDYQVKLSYGPEASRSNSLSYYFRVR